MTGLRARYPGLGSIEASVSAAVLDAARVSEVPERLAAAGDDHLNLYEGESAVELADVAPYLAPLAAGSAVNDYVFDELWGESAGILLQTDADLETLRAHFRRLLMVIDASQQVLYFRLYDPRVLRVFLPTCDAEQLEAMFGPVTAYCVEAEDPAQALRFTLAAGSLATETLDLSAGAGRGRPRVEWKG